MRWLVGGAQLTVVGVLALFVLVDLAVLASLVGGAGPRDLLVPLSGMVTVACVVLRRRGLEVATAVAVGCSLGVTLVAIGSDVQLSGADLAGLAVLAVAACRVPSPRTAGLLLAATGAAMVANGLRATEPGVVPLCVLLFVAAVMVGGYLRWLDWQRDQAAATARRDERLDLARELHDLVAHYVTGIVVQAQAAQMVADQRPEVARTALADIERAGTDALGAMRQMVGSLRAPGGAGAGAAAAELPAGSTGLRELVEQSNVAGLPARLGLHGVDPEALPPAVVASVHRIVQESLTNVRRHGVDVTRVDVDLVRHDDRVEIVVRDDGQGAARPAHGGGFGLVGMAERTTALGGDLDAGPLPEGGWQVRARLPLRSGGGAGSTAGPPPPAPR
jgi:signal transduction histidine kinase